MTRCKESILAYGISGSGKTTQIEHLAKWVFEKTGKVTRLYSADGGGWTPIQPAVDAGIVKPLWLPSNQYIIQIIDRATKGWWPDEQGTWVPPQKQKDWDTVGAIAYDSLKAIADLIMDYSLSREANEGTFRVAAEGASHVFRDGSVQQKDVTAYAAAARGHYGSVQNRISSFTAQSKCIPDRYILWTSLETKGSDESTKTPVYGPDVIGRALTSVVPAWFDRTVRLAVRQLPKGMIERRMYLQPHFEDGDPIPYLANARAHWQLKLPQFLANDDANIYNLFQLLQKEN